MITVHIVPMFNDNYCFLLHDTVHNCTAAVDPGEADKVLEGLDEVGWKLDYIFNTHHHPDHIGGNIALKEATGCKIFGFKDDAHRIPAIDIELENGELFSFGERDVEVIHIPGHTRGHIAYHIHDYNLLFCGDTLFSMGCGRLFEGSAEEMYHSLERLQQLPDETLIYCAHEYTLSNGNFALTIDPDNEDLHERMDQIKGWLAKGGYTIPTQMKVEKLTNPFLRTYDTSIRQNLNMEQATNVQVFAEIRHRKDRFKG
ncbi:MAG: hydroxyacylglutathione hydrolase [Rickettsiales bacterium]|nr:hydroxyacylglutathione hydrolase [Rickettsiales bacterium]